MRRIRNFDILRRICGHSGVSRRGLCEVSGYDLIYFDILFDWIMDFCAGNCGKRDSGIRCVSLFWIVLVMSSISFHYRFYTGFEAAKRNFKKRLGNDLPVWALLSSGSCGGVSSIHSHMICVIYNHGRRYHIGLLAIR